jgi:hypothetical protein
MVYLVHIIIKAKSFVKYVLVYIQLRAIGLKVCNITAARLSHLFQELPMWKEMSLSFHIVHCQSNNRELFCYNRTIFCSFTHNRITLLLL